MINQITVVAFQSVQLAQASFLQNNQTLQNFFFDICNAESWLFHSSIIFGAIIEISGTKWVE